MQRNIPTTPFIHPAPKFLDPIESRGFIENGVTGHRLCASVICDIHRCFPGENVEGEVNKRARVLVSGAGVSVSGRMRPRGIYSGCNRWVTSLG